MSKQAVSGSKQLNDPEVLTTKVMTITPAQARAWLEKNTVNRAPKKRQIRDIATAIERGMWDACNGETIILSDHGDLLDGQNRLYAVVLADQSIVSLVVSGVSSSKRGTIDTGFKRTLCDYFTMHGESNAPTLASACHLLHAYEMGQLRALQRGLPFTSYEEGIDFLAAHPLLRKAAPLAWGFKLFLPTSWGTMLLSLMMPLDSVLSDILVPLLSAGDFTADYPIFKRLRERLVRNAVVRAKLPHMILGVYVVKAWNATRGGDTLKQFKLGKDEPFPSVR